MRSTDRAAADWMHVHEATLHMGSLAHELCCMLAGDVRVALFGVFDGHGGKHAATFASNHVTGNLLDALQGAEGPAGTVRRHTNTLLLALLCRCACPHVRFSGMASALLQLAAEALLRSWCRRLERKIQVLLHLQTIPCSGMLWIPENSRP